MAQHEKAPIRIAMVVRPASGGIRSHVRTLIGGLDPSAYSVRLYGPANLDIPAEEAPFTPVPIGARSNALADLRAILMLSANLRETAQRPTLVHAHGLRGALIGVPAARIAGLPALFTAHNLLPSLSRVQVALLRRVARGATAIIAVSGAVAAQLKSAGIEEAKIVVIPNGVALDRFAVRADPVTVRRAHGLPPAGPLVVAVGRLAAEKGFDVLLRALYEPALAQSGVHLALAGAGPLEGELRRLAEALAGDSANRIHLLGAVEDVAALYGTAAVVAVPSRQEGQGIVALEAMAATRAVVASRVGGLAETVADGRCGLLVPPDDPGALATALATLLEKPLLRERLGQAGRRRVADHYTAAGMIGKTAALYAAISTHESISAAPARH